VKGKVVKDACSILLQEDHWALWFEGLGKPEKDKHPSDEKSAPNKIK